MRVIQLPPGVIGEAAQVRTLALSPDGRSLFAATGTPAAADRISWCDGDTGAVRHTIPLPAFPGRVTWADPAVTQDLGLAAWAGRDPRSGGDCVWLGRPGGDAPAGMPAPGTVEGLAFAPHGRLLAAATTRKQAVTVWAVPLTRHRDRVHVLDAPPVCVACPADGGDAVVVDRRGSVRRLPGVWEDWPRARGKGEVVALAVGLAGRTAVARDTFLTGWADAEGKPWRTDLPWRGSGLAYHPSGRWLAAAAVDGTLVVFDADTGREHAAFATKVGRLGAVAFAPDGLTLAAGGDRGRVALIDFDA